ncbi:MAG: adenylyltransferase/cytidyltransferase family protein [Candidatus Micrarchaeota archaeon]|nr:adenylyltransferase/cytidyltransferase family protein [Candidatus Micrarchaeota archaeon]
MKTKTSSAKLCFRSSRHVSPNVRVILFPGRFQPFHNGHCRILSRLLRRYAKVIVVLGSCDLNGADHPFSPALRKKMIRACFPKSKNLFFAAIPFAPDRMWVKTLLKKVPRRRFDAVFTNNPRVQKQLKKAGIAFICGPLYRRNLWQGKTIRKKRDWTPAVPKAVARLKPRA